METGDMFSAHFIEDLLSSSFLLLFSIVMFTAAIETRVTILLFSLVCLLSVSGPCYLSISEYNSYLIYNLIRGSLWRFIVNYVLTLVLRGVSPLKQRIFISRKNSWGPPLPLMSNVHWPVTLSSSLSLWCIHVDVDDRSCHILSVECFITSPVTCYNTQVRYKFLISPECECIVCAECTLPCLLSK